MTWRTKCALLLGGLLIWAAATRAASPTDRTPHELFDALNALGGVVHAGSVSISGCTGDPSCTPLGSDTTFAAMAGAGFDINISHRIALRRGDATLSFDEGKLAFFLALDGHITGAVFSGRGHVLAAPRDPVEKQQMARFLNATVLDEDFTSAYLRFTDDAAKELLAELHERKIPPQNDDAFAGHWESLIAEFNAGQSLHLLDGLLTENPKPYFYSAIEGTVTGAFDLFYDLQRREPFLLGQPRRPMGQSSGPAYYDVWVSYALPGDAEASATFRALNYTIETTIAPNKNLEATATIEMQALAGGERLLPFALARSLLIDSVTDEQGAPVSFFQNEGLSALARNDTGSDVVYVVMSRAVPAGQHFRLGFRYRGNVIEEAGNGVLVVQARDSSSQCSSHRAPIGCASRSSTASIAWDTGTPSTQFPWRGLIWANMRRHP